MGQTQTHPNIVRCERMCVCAFMHHGLQANSRVNIHARAYEALLNYGRGDCDERGRPVPGRVPRLQKYGHPGNRCRVATSLLTSQQEQTAMPLLVALSPTRRGGGAQRSQPNAHSPTHTGYCSRGKDGLYLNNGVSGAVRMLVCMHHAEWVEEREGRVQVLLLKWEGAKVAQVRPELHEVVHSQHEEQHVPTPPSVLECDVEVSRRRHWRHLRPSPLQKAGRGAQTLHAAPQHQVDLAGKRGDSGLVAI
mmetsp:Transcript_1725/g.3841  ORF Transcript_1725/g.3841 Transcript_1725/m.3841 type:complete len:249 (-) Transcript_1725:252-998(-)